MKVSECIKNTGKASAFTIKDGRKSYLCNFMECLMYFGNREVKRVAYPNYMDGSDNSKLPILYLAK